MNKEKERGVYVEDEGEWEWLKYGRVGWGERKKLGLRGLKRVSEGEGKN